MSKGYIAMIPARLGSQRLKKKNLAELAGKPLIAHAIEKCLSLEEFDAVWVNSESEEIGDVARSCGANFHLRPAALANNVATSEQFIAEFLEAHDCEAVVQVHSIAPLLSAGEIQRFMQTLQQGQHDTLISCIHDQIEVAYRNEPVNFTFSEKTNSQDLEPVQRMTWAISAWRRAPYLDAIKAGRTATYSGRVGLFPVDAVSGHVIKTQRDLEIASALLSLIEGPQ